MIRIDNEVSYYNEIAKALTQIILDNLSDPEKYRIVPLIGEISSALQTLIVNGYDASDLLKQFSESVHRLHLDVSILIENLETRKFELVIFEVKIGKNLGLTELSQLIGYCLVTKNHFGILLNINHRVSNQFEVILDGDPDLTKIDRMLGDEKVTHEFGVMIYNSTTKNFEYTEAGSIKTLSSLIEKVKNYISI